MINKIFIIHQSKNTNRYKYIHDLIHTYPNCEIIEPIIPKDLSIYGGRRRNNKFITAELSLTLTNLFILNKIIKNKLNNVIIFEDDAIQINPLPLLDTTAYSIYLHNFRHPKQALHKIYDCQAMYYPSWKNTKKIYNYIKNETHILAWDNQLQFIKEKYNLYNKLIQTNKMIFIQATGKSSIVTNYFNNRYFPL